jgi:hypothetical protein
MASDFDCNMMLANDLIIGCGRDKMICRSQKYYVSPWWDPWICAPFGLWWRIGFRLDYTRAVWWLWLVYRRCQGDWHDAKCLWLKQLHGSSNIFFHKLSYLFFCAIIRPLVPSRSVSSTFTAFFLITPLDLLDCLTINISEIEFIQSFLLEQLCKELLLVKLISTLFVYIVFGTTRSS